MEMENGLISLDSLDGQCLRHEHALPFKKMEEIIQMMQGATDGVSMENSNNKCAGNAFTGANLISWLTSHVTERDGTEASHVSRMLKRFNYIYSVAEAETGRRVNAAVVLVGGGGGDAVAMTPQDNSLYRFQAPYYWPSLHVTPDDVDYAIYLFKKSSSRGGREVLTEHEQADLEKLKQLHCDSWDFIQSQSQEQINLLYEYTEGDRQVILGQEKVFWRMRRPPPGEIDVMETKYAKGSTLKSKMTPTEDDLIRKRDFLKNLLNSQRIKVSKVFDSLLQRSRVYMEHDPMFTQPEPFNPWLTDDLSFWSLNDNNGQPEVISERRLKRWSISMHDLIKDSRGLRELRSFLESEFSSENIEFLLAVWRFKSLPLSEVEVAACDIYKKFLEPGSEKEINIDSKTMSLTLQREKRPNRCMFEEAEEHIYSLMERDSYQRFLRSEQYKNLFSAAQNQTGTKKKKFSFGFKKRGTSHKKTDTDQDKKSDKLAADVISRTSSISSSSSTAVATAPCDSSCSGDSSDNCSSQASDSQEWLNDRNQMSYSTGDLKTETGSYATRVTNKINIMGRFSPLRLKKKLAKMVRSVSPLPHQSNLSVPKHHHHHHHHQHEKGGASVESSSTDLRKNMRSVLSVPGNLCGAVKRND